MSEEKLVEPGKPEGAKKMTAADLQAALQTEFATTVNRVYVNSLGREVGFREISVKQQKTLSRIMIDNERRKDVVFEAQCALINEASLDPQFDVFDCSEFDRLKLLIALYQSNMFKNDVTFHCENCGCDNKFKLDFRNVLARLDKISLEPKTFEYENDLWKFSFEVGYPTVRQVLAFHKANAKNYFGAKKQQIASIDSMSNMDYVNLFIRTIDMAGKKGGGSRRIVMADYPVGDAESIVSVFPQDVLYSDAGVLKFIVAEYIKKINDTFDAHNCFQCGAPYEGDVASAQSFF